MKNDEIIVDSKEIGKSLKRIRLTHNLSQKEFANILNVSSLLVSKWENGERTPRIETFKRINKIYGITFEEITTGSFKPNLSKRKALKHLLRFNITKISIIIIIIMIMFLGALIENQTKIFNIGIETNNININKGTLIINNDYIFNIDEIDNSKFINRNILVNFYIIKNQKELLYSCVINKKVCNKVFKSNIISKEEVLKNLDNIYVELVDNNEVVTNKVQLTLLSNSQELRNMVIIPNELIKKSNKEEKYTNCVFVNKKELYNSLANYNKMFKYKNNLYVIRKDNNSYLIYNKNNHLIVTESDEDLYYYNDNKTYNYLKNNNGKFCFKNKDSVYDFLLDVISYYL